MTEDQRLLYDNVGEVRNTDVILRWSIAGVFITLHSVGLTFVATQLTGGKSIPKLGYVGGIVLGILWLIIAERMQKWITYWNSRLEMLEAAVEPQTIKVFGGDEYRYIVTDWGSTYNALWLLILVIILVWLGLLLKALVVR